jgi:hypothetical protein
VLAGHMDRPPPQPMVPLSPCRQLRPPRTRVRSRVALRPSRPWVPRAGGASPSTWLGGVADWDGVVHEPGTARGGSEQVKVLTPHRGGQLSSTAGRGPKLGPLAVSGPRELATHRRMHISAPPTAWPLGTASRERTGGAAWLGAVTRMSTWRSDRLLSILTAGHG